MSIKKDTGKGKKKVLVGLSGGVDSAVAACLLKRQGYDVTGVYMRFWASGGGEKPDKSPVNKCCTIEALNKAIHIAKKIRIPLLILDFKRQFKKKVVDPFINDSGNRLTPNPCIECNRSIKFGLFLEKMKQLKADFVATGHYARVKKSGRGGYELYAATDKLKDQSYFLHTLTREKLRRILFPLGDMKKSRVRLLARKFGLDEINDQKESQNLCFLPGDETEPFLRKHLKNKKAISPGPILTTSGLSIGRHRGLPFYTIGQRKRLGIGGIRNLPDQHGNPWYVINYDAKKNALVVGHDSDLYTRRVCARNLTFVGGRAPGTARRVTAKIRYGAAARPAVLKIIAAGSGGGAQTAEIIFKSGQRAVTPGQSIVFYDGAKVLGGGIIA